MTTIAAPAPDHGFDGVDMQLVGRIVELFEQADQQGRSRPGRPFLRDVTGATDYKVRNALQYLAWVESLPGHGGAALTPDGVRSRRERPSTRPDEGNSGEIMFATDLTASVEPDPPGSPGAPGDQPATDTDGALATDTTEPGVRVAAAIGKDVAGSEGGAEHMKVERAAGDSGVAAGDRDDGGVGSKQRRAKPRTGSGGAARRRARSASSAPPAGSSAGGTGDLDGPVQSVDSGAVRPRPELATAPAGGAKLASWAGFVFGSVMSIAANVLHTWLPADRMSPGWAPSISSQVGAAVWPIGLLLSVEILSRVHWKPGWQWALARFGGTGTVALGAAVISYGHVRDVLTAWGYGTLAAHVGPLVLDGLMVVSGFALLAMSGSPAVASHVVSGVSGRGAVDSDHRSPTGPGAADPAGSSRR